MSDRTWASNAVVEGLLEWGIEDFSYVPSSHIAPVVRPLQERGVRSHLAAREEEGVGLAGGLVLGGRKAALLMQDNGFGNALTALATFAKAYHIGMPVVSNTRGGPGEYNAMIHSFSEAVPDLLHALGIRVERLGPSDPEGVWQSTTRAAAELAIVTRRPVVVLLDLLHPGIGEQM
ncbi:MAG TPA: thiamine pyrophosphate-binding protein [Actinomycetota bacterium]|nr:thiamine pyrophosphate-binding protein [Actinomycetota bacterium]